MIWANGLSNLTTVTSQKDLRAGKMGQQLRASADGSEDPSSIPSTTCPEASEPSPGLLEHQVYGAHTFRQNTHARKIKNRRRKKAEPKPKSPLLLVTVHGQDPSPSLVVSPGKTRQQGVPPPGRQISYWQSQNLAGNAIATAPEMLRNYCCFLQRKPGVWYTFIIPTFKEAKERNTPSSTD